MNKDKGLERTLPDQKNITASFSQETPLLINGTLKFLSSQEAIMLTDLPQGGNYDR